MISYKWNSLLLLIVLVTGNIWGQQPPAYGPGIISGKVVDAVTGHPLEFATISIFRADSSLVTGTITKSDGSFSVELKPGGYSVAVQFISYQQERIDNILLSSRNKEHNMGEIKLHPSAEILDEVAVVAEKSEMIINLDKKIFNVGKDLSNTGQSALDILDNIPSVTVDLDGNVSLRGSENLQILVDGKPSGLVSAGGTDALKSMQGNIIDRIEVITNPSARYEAEGMAGIINIVLRKDQQKGVNGSFELTTGYPADYGLGANVNFRRDKINYFVNYNIRYNERPGGGNSYQRFTLPDTSYITVRDQDRLRTGFTNRIRAGADFFLNPTNTITAAVLLSNDNQINTSDITYYDYLYNADDTRVGTEVPDDIAYLTHRVDKEEEDEVDIEFSLNYEKKFDDKDHKFTALVQYIKDAETEKSIIEQSTESYIPPLGTSYTTERVFNEESERNLHLQADYIYPFGDKGKFEAGYRGGFRKIENPYYVDSLNQDGEWENIEKYSNEFEYIENIHAFYLQAGNNYGKLGIQAGLRTEISDVNTILHTTNEENHRLYVDFFPSLHTSLQFNQVHSGQLSYSRRIHRPHFWLLNPFYSYTDPRNFRSGNPNLNPEYTHSLELGYLFKKTIVDAYAGVYYRYTTNNIERIVEVDTNGVTVVVPQNLDQGQSYGLEANASVDPVKWWTISGDFNFYRFMTSGTYNDVEYSSDDYSWHTRLNSKMRFKGGTNLQFIFFYRAPRATTQGSRGNFYMLNAALSQDVLKGKGTLTFNVRDVLDSRKFKYTYDGEDMFAVNEYRRSGRLYTLTFIYRLNQQKRMSRNNGGNGDFGGGDEVGF